MESRFTSKARKLYADRVDIATDAARAVRATLDTPGWALIQQVLASEADETDRRSEFHPDKVQDQAVYAARIAYREGLLASREVAAELVRFADVMERRFAEANTAPAEGRS